jgi:nitroreductase
MKNDSSANTADVVLGALAAHATVRAFESTPVPPRDLERAIAAAQCAATSSNMQAYGLITVTDGRERARLAELCGNQPQVREAGLFLVVCGDLARQARVCERAGAPLAANFEAFLLATIDAALFAQNLVVALEALGHGTCYIGGLRNRLPEVDALLELPRLVLPLFGLCVGTPRERPAVKPRLAPQAVLHEGRYRASRATLGDVDEYDARMAEYYAARGKPHHTWSGALARLLAEPRRPHLFDYYTQKGITFDARENAR